MSDQRDVTDGIPFDGSWAKIRQNDIYLKKRVPDDDIFQKSTQLLSIAKKIAPKRSDEFQHFLRRNGVISFSKLRHIRRFPTYSNDVITPSKMSESV